MYAVVSSGGKQYRVEPGSTVVIDRLSEEPGASITFDRVLLIGDGDETTVGTPLVSGATVSGTVLGEELGPKLVIFKFKQKVKYRRRTGHRQHLVRVRIDAINADGESTRAKAEKAEQAEAAPKAAKAPAKRAPRAKAASASKASTEEKPKATRKPRATKAKAEKPAEE
jgi:large subunit ribosomal protein L21